MGVTDMSSLGVRVLGYLLPSCGYGPRLIPVWLGLLITIASCGERPQVVLRFRPEDLAELDTLELALLDGDGHPIALPDQNQVPVASLLDRPSLYLNEPIKVPLDVSVRFVGRASGNCTIAAGETAKTRLSEMGQTIDVPLSFVPRLTLKQRSEAPPRPGNLDFTVTFDTGSSDGERPSGPACKSKAQPNVYFIPKASQVRVEVRAEDSFTVFDGWDDKDCPAEGECSVRRTQTIDTDTTWTAKFASWNCLKPDEFCELAPIPKRYESAVRGQSGTSAWVAPNGDVWISGLVGLPNKPSGSRGIVKKWTGNNWIDATPRASPWTKELWDISGTVDAGTIYAVGPDGIFSLTTADWSKSDANWKNENVSGFSAGAIWVGANDGVWAAGSGVSAVYPQVWHRSASAGSTWSSIGETLLKTQAGKTFHAVVGDDNGTLVVSGRQGILVRITWPAGSIADLSPGNTASLYASAWSQKKKLFSVASSDEVHLLSTSSSAVETFKPVDKLMGNLFGLWFDPATDDESLGLWATGSFAYNYKCNNPKSSDISCSRVLSPFDTAKSSRRLVGPDLEHLWVVGYERDKLESAAIQLGRYCPTTQCRRP